MLVLSDALVLAESDEPGPDNAVIGWRNVVAYGYVSADTEDPDFPAANLANPATNLEWRALAAGASHVTVTTNEIDPIDYIAVARHNFASAAIAVKVEGYVSGAWTQMVQETMLPDDGPALFRFAPQSLSQIRLTLAAGSAAPRAAVVYVGRLLVLERKIWAGHVPMPHGRRTRVTNGRSESGTYLGRIVTGEWRETKVPLTLLTPAWVRAELDPFLAVALDLPFFFAWRPATYPREVGFGTLVNHPDPVNEAPSNLVSLELQITGIA